MIEPNPELRAPAGGVAPPSATAPTVAAGGSGFTAGDRAAHGGDLDGDRPGADIELGDDLPADHVDPAEPDRVDPVTADPDGARPAEAAPGDEADGQLVTGQVVVGELVVDEDADDLDDEVDGSDAQDPFAALGALFGGGGSNPLAGLLEQAQQLQAGMQDAQRRLSEQSVSGTSGGGLVRATVSGTGELTALRIDPSVVDPTDVDTLVDLVIAAVRAATADARALNERTMAGAVPDFGGLTGAAAGGGPSAGFGFGGGDPGAGMPDLEGIPDFGSMPGFGTVPDLRRIPGAGPLAGPAGDDPDDDDLGPAGRPAGV